MDYEIHFASPTRPGELVAALADEFGVAATEVVVESASLPRAGGAPPLVLITGPAADDPHFGCVLSAGDEFAQRNGGRDELTVAATLCRKVGTSALIPHEEAVNPYWRLIDADGTSTLVDLDETALESGRLVPGPVHPPPTPADPA
ncbi:hypothetical protein LX16_1281 [Stackebrandtia albiflava]|uniref:Uncharacterized protein n=1 Tax=Stackebrandtia albiflava TaxID=406432 RepID=A0A562VCH6_9ACTN|nr:hypothetical protein [Stackebrandtia albiflava]TWJ15570.1 hypothetical protein LX16_1281 [Stackebrandtia albiflava]